MQVEWSTQPLGELVEVLDHLRVPVNSDERAKRPGGVPYYGANGQQGWIDRPLFNEPLVLLAEDGGNFDDFRTRPIAYRIDGPSWVNNHAHIIRALFGVDQDFIFWTLVHKDIRRYIAGGTRTKLTQGELRSIHVSVPPLPEQRRIAEILDTLDAAIRKTEEVIAKLQQMKQGLLHDLLTRGIDDNGELRDPERHPEQFKDSPLGWIPKEWDPWRVGDLFDMQLGKMLSKQASAGPCQRPYLANRHVQWGRISLSELETMSFTPAEQEKYRLVHGDLLVCEGGEIGRTALWRGETQDIYFQKAIHRLRPKGGILLPGFMLRFMLFAAERGMFTDLSSQTSIAHLTQEKLALLRVPRPPTSEQQRLVSVFDQVDAQAEAEDVHVGKLRTLKHGLMDDLLTGRVRISVPEEAAA
jgi:type I restriction enzyme S subunit